MKQLGFIILCFMVSACVGPRPVTEEVLSDVALSYIKDVPADSSMSTFASKARSKNQRAKKLLEVKKNEEAKKLFIEARILAEKIETKIRVDQMKSGELF